MAWPSALVHWSETAGTSPYFLVVDKSQRNLSIWKSKNPGFEKVIDYPADIGKLDGNKSKRGDHRTPEGIYWLNNKLTSNQISFDLYGSLAFVTDYPNVFDKAELKTGDGIWLHAIPDTVPLTRGSRGCVVVRNDVIKEIDQYVQPGITPIVIFDKVENAPSSLHSAKYQQVNSFIEGWKKSWSLKNIESYISFYHEQFKALGMNLNAWKRYKSRLNDNYESIKVSFSDPVVLNHNNQWIIRMVQNYESNKYADVGLKTLYVVQNGSEFKILTENWQPSKSSQASIDLRPPASKSN